MKQQLLTWDVYNLTTNYDAFIVSGAPLLTPSDVVWTEIAGNWPAMTGKRFAAGGYLAIQLVYTDALSNQHVRENEIKRWFEVLDKAPRVFKRLTAQDTADGNRRWYVDATPISVVPENNSALIVLALKTPAWTIETPTTANWVVTDTGTPTQMTFTIKGHYGRPRFSIRPTSPLTSGGYDFIEFRDVQPPSASITLGYYPLDVGNALNIAALLKDNANKCQINAGAGIGAEDVTIPYDTVTGTVPTSGTGMMESEQFSWTGKTGTTSGNLTGCIRHINGTSPAAHADNIVIFKSKVMYNGDDFQVLVDGVAAPRWFGNWNTTSLKVWVVLPWSPKVNLVLQTAIPASGDISEIVLKDTPTNVALLSKLVSYGGQSGIVKIGTEYLTYTGIDLTLRKLTGVVRAAKDSSPSIHTTGSTVIWIQHDITIMYGNLAAEAWTQDDSLQPIFDLNSSTNSSWVFTVFRDRSSLSRAMSWVPARLYSKLKSSNPYFGFHGADADPATEMGLKIADKKVSNVWKSEDAILTATLYCPAGISALNSITGATFRANTDWPDDVRLERSVDGKTWIPIVAIASPGSANVWTAWAPANQAITSSTRVRLLMDGTLKAANANYTAVELQGITVVPTAANVPVVTSGSAFSNYSLDAYITNISTGEWLRITWPMRLNQIIYLDCETRQVTHADGSPCPVSVQLSSERVPWLDFHYGTNGQNLLQWDQLGTSGVVVGVSEYDKVAI